MYSKDAPFACVTSVVEKRPPHLMPPPARQYSCPQYSWWCDADSGGGALNALGSHVIDALYFITGMRARAVAGVVKTYVETTPKLDVFRHITSGTYTGSK